MEIIDVIEAMFGFGALIVGVVIILGAASAVVFKKAKIAERFKRKKTPQ